MARLSAIWRGLLLSFRDFPVEAFISVSAFVLTLLSNEKVIETAFPLVYFFPLVVLSFCLHRISGRKGTLVWKACYFASALFWIPLYCWKPELGEAGIVVMYLISFILLFSADGRYVPAGAAAMLTSGSTKLREGMVEPRGTVLPAAIFRPRKYGPEARRAETGFDGAKAPVPGMTKAAPPEEGAAARVKASARACRCT